MNARITKEDQLIYGIMKEFEMSNPPEDFTAKVMERVEMESFAPEFKSKPLISKAGWIGIGVGVLILMLLILLSSNGESSSQSWVSGNLSWNLRLPHIDFEKWRILDLSSPTLTWIILGTGGIMLLALIERWIEEHKFRQTLFL